jgi:GNAT superfamily N-acetyltransferase
VQIIELHESGPLFESLYYDVLVPSFPKSELNDFEVVQRAVDSGRDLVWVALDDAGQVIGGAVGEWEEEYRIILLAWFAVRPGQRGGGIGGPLLDAAVAAWREQCSPCLILAEIEDPAQHETVKDEYGDPAARLRFYQRHGTRALDVPYFQPSLDADSPRVHGLLLAVLHVDPALAGSDPDTVDSEVLLSYMTDYLESCEGAAFVDEEAKALEAALNRPGGVPFRD